MASWYEFEHDVLNDKIQTRAEAISRLQLMLQIHAPSQCVHGTCAPLENCIIGDGLKRTYEKPTDLVPVQVEGKFLSK